MSQPPPYDRQFNFQNQQSLTPADPIPADELDSELNSIKITLDATLANLAGIQRDDGQLGNDTVGVDQLKPELDNFAAASIAAIAAKVAAEAAAVAAANSASSASTSAMAADTAKTGAQVSEVAAEAAQAAAEAAAIVAEAAIGDMAGTSTTSSAIGLGLKSFVTQEGKFFDVGSWLLVTSDAAPATDYMHGVVTTYVGTALVVNATTFGGSGTHADWTIRVSGTQGAPGTPGADGAAGAPGIQFAFDSSTADSDPGTGKFRFNNASLSLATALYVDNAEFNGTDIAPWLDGFDDSGSAADRGTLRIINPEVPIQLYVYKVTGSVVDGTGYRKLTIAHVSGAEGLSVGAPFSFAMFPTGATGPAGPPGAGGATLADGDYGDIVASGGGTSIMIDTGVVTTAKMGGDVTTAGKALLDDASAGVQRTTLGVGTGDSPEFAAVNIGHATDTTLARSGVGDITVEGKTVYRADGTDVPVADGGSGRSTATAYAVLCGGTTTTAAHQSVAAVGVAGEVLTSNGAGALPTFQTGGGGAIVPPQGRLTLVTATPVMTTTQSAKTTVYYTPIGLYVPLYNGTTFTMTSIVAELSQATTDATKSPAAAAADSNYDLFVWSDSGTMRCTRGPAWTSDTGRGTGAGTTELVNVNGIELNAFAITNGPAASRGTCVGTIRTNASSQVDFIFGAAAAGGTAAVIGLENKYNRVKIGMLVQNTTASWSYNSTTPRQPNGSTTFRVYMVRGSDNECVSSWYHCVGSGGSAGDYAVALSYDGSTTPIGQAGWGSFGDFGSVQQAMHAGFPGLGWHYVNPLEMQATTATSATYFGVIGGRNVNGLLVETMY